MKQRAPARAAASAASAVGASVKRGCSAAVRKHRIRETGLTQLAAQLPQAAEQADARLDLEQQPVGSFDGHLRRERGGDAGQALHEREFARRIARPRIECGRGRERRAECHADAHARRLRVRIRVDDARIAVASSSTTSGAAWRSAAAMASSGSCGTCAAIHNSRGSSSSAACRKTRPRGRRRRRPHP